MELATLFLIKGIQVTFDNTYTLVPADRVQQPCLSTRHRWLAFHPSLETKRAKGAKVDMLLSALHIACIRDRSCNLEYGRDGTCRRREYGITGRLVAIVT